MWAVIKKEFKSYFLSPIGYIYIGIFLLLCSLFFYIDIFSYQSTMFSQMFGYSCCFNISCSSINNENVFWRKKKWNRTIIANVTKECNINSTWKVFCCMLCCTYFNICNINLLWNIMLFWKTTFCKFYCCNYWIFIIVNGLCIIWYVCIKFNWKSSNFSNNFSRIFLVIMVFT